MQNAVRLNGSFPYYTLRTNYCSSVTNNLTLIVGLDALGHRDLACDGLANQFYLDPPIKRGRRLLVS